MDVREELAGLSALELEVLAALALVGDAALTPDELAGLSGVDDVGWAVAELVRRGLVRVDDEDRAQVLPAWRKVLAAADRAQTILERAVDLAESGRLSPETLLGLTAWALRAGRYRETLAVIRAAQEALAIVRRVEAWSELLERAATAARALGDREAEEWAARRLAASRELGGASVRRHEGSALARRLLTGAAVAAAGAAGLVVGLVALDGPDPARADPAGVTTALVTQQETVVETVVGTVTVAVPTTVTVTEPGPVETVTDTVTETVTTTVTVTVEPPPPPQPPSIPG